MDTIAVNNVGLIVYLNGLNSFKGYTEYVIVIKKGLIVHFKSWWQLKCKTKSSIQLIINNSNFSTEIFEYLKHL